MADLLYDRREALGSDDGGESQIAMKDVLYQMDAAQLEHADIHAGLRSPAVRKSAGFKTWYW